MKLYLKSGQVVNLKEVQAIACGLKTYWVGKETDTNYISRSLI